MFRSCGWDTGKVCELNIEVIFTGDLNIDWLLQNCPLKHRLVTKTDVCGLKQMVRQPTRISTNNKGNSTSACIDHVYLSEDDFYTKAIAVPVQCRLKWSQCSSNCKTTNKQKNLNTQSQAKSCA